MKDVVIVDPKGPEKRYSDSVIEIDEGLIGFSKCKNFVFLENEAIAPFRLLESVDSPEIGFVVLDPTILIREYNSLVPDREWESVGVTDSSKRLAFVITVIGSKPQESTANLQAPILINYETMTARQVILTDSGLSVRHPLV